MTPTIGSISHGTHRPQDLIGSYLWELKSLLPVYEYQELTGKLDDMVKRTVTADALSDDDFDPSEAIDEARSEALQYLTEQLEALAPVYTYFGAHPGDGSDFGFWPDFDGMDRDAGGKDADLFKVSDTAEAEGYTGTVMHVNDHGNVELYSAVAGELTPIWSCV
jgi:hypothetical protein